MKVTPQFLAAKNDKSLSSILVTRRAEGEQREYKPRISLVLDMPIKFTDKKEQVYVTTDTEIRVSNYSSCGKAGERKSDEYICFYETTYGECHFKTFLQAIRKDSEVSFEVVAYNGSDAWNEVNFVSHQLYGRIDNKRYLLSFFIGNDNSASPVRANY